MVMVTLQVYELCMQISKKGVWLFIYDFLKFKIPHLNEMFLYTQNNKNELLY